MQQRYEGMAAYLTCSSVPQYQLSWHSRIYQVDGERPVFFLRFVTSSICSNVGLSVAPVQPLGATDHDSKGVGHHRHLPDAPCKVSSICAQWSTPRAHTLDGPLEPATLPAKSVRRAAWGGRSSRRWQWCGVWLADAGPKLTHREACCQQGCLLYTRGQAIGHRGRNVYTRRGAIQK